MQTPAVRGATRVKSQQEGRRDVWLYTSNVDWHACM
jgi:hypothetical protein